LDSFQVVAPLPRHTLAAAAVPAHDELIRQMTPEQVPHILTLTLALIVPYRADGH
jgi:hypothetical protein